MGRGDKMGVTRGRCRVRKTQRLRHRDRQKTDAILMKLDSSVKSVNNGKEGWAETLALSVLIVLKREREREMFSGAWEQG